MLNFKKKMLSLKFFYKKEREGFNRVMALIAVIFRGGVCVG